MSYLTTAARQEFDRWSRHYDRTWLQRFFFKPAHRMLLQELQDDPRDLLDVGCGTGKFAVRVLGRLPQARVYGLDLSEGMLAVARHRSQATKERLCLVRADSERLPFADNSFDSLTCTHSFHHYPHPKLVLAEMHRVLRPGGRLFIIDGDRDRLWGRFVFNFLVVLMEGPVRHLKGHAFRRLFRQAGFADIEQRRRGGPLPFLLTTGRAVKMANCA
jgi:ubiquinone/menaquinone biosynthesis C-methylase UbiE